MIDKKLAKAIDRHQTMTPEEYFHYEEENEEEEEETEDEKN